MCMYILRIYTYVYIYMIYIYIYVYIYICSTSSMYYVNYVICRWTRVHDNGDCGLESREYQNDLLTTHNWVCLLVYEPIWLVQDNPRNPSEATRCRLHHLLWTYWFSMLFPSLRQGHIHLVLVTTVKHRTYRPATVHIYSYLMWF